MTGKLAPGSTGAARSIVPVTPSDTDDLPNGITRAVLIGDTGGGPVSLIDASGAERTNVPLQQGWNPIAVIRILETGTTPTDIWAAY